MCNNSPFNYKINFLLIFSIIFSNCSVTRDQIKDIENFSTLVSSFHHYPSDIFSSLMKIQSERKLLLINTIENNPKYHVKSIDSLFDFDIKNKNKIQKYNLCVKFLRDYIHLLNHIINNKFNKAYLLLSSIESSLEHYNSHFLNIGEVPVQITGLVFGISSMISLESSDAKKLKKLRKTIKDSQVMINKMIDHITTFLSSTEIKSLLKEEKQLLKENYISFLQKNGFSLENDQKYLILRKELRMTTKKIGLTIKAFENIKKAHILLNNKIQKKTSLKEDLPELKDIFKNLANLNSNFHPIKLLNK